MFFVGTLGFFSLARTHIIMRRVYPCTVRLAEEHKDVKFVKVDVDANHQVEYLLHAGRVVDRLAQQARRAGLAY